jgi:hypothetical protein
MRSRSTDSIDGDSTDDDEAPAVLQITISTTSTDTVNYGSNQADVNNFIIDNDYSSDSDDDEPPPLIQLGGTDDGNDWLPERPPAIEMDDDWKKRYHLLISTIVHFDGFDQENYRAVPFEGHTHEAIDSTYAVNTFDT